MADFDISTMDLTSVKSELIIAQRECYGRRLLQAAKWAAEMSKAIEIKVDPRTLKPPEEGEEFWDEYDAYMLAMSYFDLKEYDRAVHCLRECHSPKPYFLKHYSLYMSDQKRKADNMPDSNAQIEPVENDTLKILQTELAEKYGKKKLDGYGIYLYGVVLARLELHPLALQLLQEAVTLEPMNWAAWCELARLVADKDMLVTLKLPRHWVRQLFTAKVYMELQLHDQALDIYRGFTDKGFNQSSYMVSQIAVTYHDMREVDQAVVMFKCLEVMDPYRMENMDTYSNLLYIKEMKSDLAHLAHRCCTINKYCIETCCVIGNYYSLREQHEKSILYFQRALKLNSNYISAWTLMGHEYMSLKNTSAAIQAYRRSIEVEQRDYRAWYGLGQTYEILKMPSYSLYYYKKAQALKPNDSRMVLALGECYQKVERMQEAKKCFWKAHCLGDSQAIALVKLANLYSGLGEKEQAFQAFTEYIKQADMLLIQHHDDLSAAYMYLATYHMEHKHWDLAYQAAQKCTEFAETREEAKAMQRLIQAQRSSEEIQIQRSTLDGVPVVSMIDDSMSSLHMEGHGAARAFGRVTPVNLKFTP